jgi:predicted nucleic acid-binding protein
MGGYVEIVPADSNANAHAKGGGPKAMRILLDTNIIIHREAAKVMNRDIGILYRWLDELHYTKCIHPITVAEINRLRVGEKRDVFNVKLSSYHQIKTIAPLAQQVVDVSQEFDTTDNDLNDTALLNELFNERVDFLVTEDRKIRKKAQTLGISDRVYTIDSFLEKVTAENPGLADYKVLSVKREYFGNIDLSDPFFESFKEDYPGFEKWFNRKSDEQAYVCNSEQGLTAFLYLKIEGPDEPYSDIEPRFERKRRLKIGTMKVTLNGYKLGERFLKIVFDNALRNRVDEIYVTIFRKRFEQERLVSLLEDFGFVHHGSKMSHGGAEEVYIRSLEKGFDLANPRLTYPYFSTSSRTFIVPIYPEYHTNLFPDSILRTESPLDYVEHEPYRNAISKVYISRSLRRDLRSGDLIIFYRTGGYYKSVVTTIGIVESVIDGISDAEQFVRLCRKRSVFSDEELLKHWNYSKNRPFIVNFLYAYSFPHRLNMQRLIELGVIRDVNSAPRGFEPISQQDLVRILEETKTDAGIVVD